MDDVYNIVHSSMNITNSPELDNGRMRPALAGQSDCPPTTHNFFPLKPGHMCRASGGCIIAAMPRLIFHGFEIGREKKTSDSRLLPAYLLARKRRLSGPV